ncbi:MAG: translesion error-prone DNA polymerase V autoproteolytic subunit [Candidatus Tenebribacter davisii]|jgi:DNA polymerase V|nr:translesion error-prone DNA polymerase V autoproteolytic subunit [Candidatus Tenebribacter davisii]
MGINLSKQKANDIITNIFNCKISTSLPRPLLGNEVPAGFPSPAQDYIEENLDLNEHLISHPSATYFVKVEGYSMVDAGIYPGDILIVDRAIEATHKKIVIAIVDGELTVKRLYKKNGKWFLAPENPEFESLEITRDINFHIWGVVIYSIHKMS